MSSPISNAPLPYRRRVASGLTLLFLVFVTTLFWWHNRDILRDLFDYSAMIAAAGKVEAGLKPYADVRAPMQSAVYLLSRGTEWIFGRSYLALTWGGLVQALGGALLVRGLLAARLGPFSATGMALAIAAAGLLQHAIFFYNAIGILCFAVVLLGLAAEPDLWPGRSWRGVAVLAALFLSGINKLNFLGATLVLAGLLSLAAWKSERITFKVMVRNLLLLMLCGLVLPLAFELAWTGATLRQWVENVILLPGARYNYLKQAVAWRIYLRPAHDFHHHLLVPAMGGIGLALLVATGTWLFSQARSRHRPWSDVIARLAIIAGGVVMGALLMITNHETVVLTSLSYLIVAVACYVLFRETGRRPERWIVRTLSGAVGLWLVVGGYAAWHGSRLLFGPNPPPRSDYVRWQPSAPALAYFGGVRLLPPQSDAWERLAARLQDCEDANGQLHGFIFGPGTEWLERAYPGAILREAPLWYDAGTTLRESDTDYFVSLLDKGSRRIVAQRGWQHWTAGITQFLSRDYRQENVGSRDVIYHPRGAGVPAVSVDQSDLLAPAVYRDAVAGNVQIKSTLYSAGMAVDISPAGAAFGASGSTNWSWPGGTYDAEGKAVARLRPAATGSAVVTFRVMAGDSVNGELLWETPVRLGPDRREVVLPLKLQPGGRAVWLQTESSAGDSPEVFGGWREMRITHTNERDQSPAVPFGHGLSGIPEGNAGAMSSEFWFARDPATPEPGGWVTLPAENWRRDTQQSGKLSITAEVAADPANPGDHIVVTLAWYRASRFEIMTEQEIDPRVTTRLTLDAYVPEPGGWVGLLARTGKAQPRVRVISWGR